MTDFGRERYVVVYGVTIDKYLTCLDEHSDVLCKGLNSMVWILIRFKQYFSMKL